MGVVYNFDSLARVLTEAKPITYNGSWEVIKGGLLEAGEISEEAGVVQKVISINRATTTTETAGETLSALCAMEVEESTISGATVTTLTPKAAITFTPKTIALCAIAGAVGLDFGFRIGQNLANLYFGNEWDWQAPGIFDKAKDMIRTYVKADGTTYYDEETINAFSNRLNDVGAFKDYSIITITPEDIAKKVNEFEKLSLGELIAISPSTWQTELMKVVERYNLDLSNNTYGWIIYCGYYNHDYPTRQCRICFTHGTNGIAKITSFGNYETALPSYIVNNTYGYKNITTSHSNNTCYAIATEINGSFRFITPPYGDANFNSPWNNHGFDLDSHPFFIANNLTGMSKGGITGVTKQEGATVPSKFPLEIPETYPTWTPSPLNNPDGANQIYPVEMPDTNPIAEKTTKPQDDAQKGKNQDPENNPVIENSIINLPEIVPNIQTQPAPTIDDGETPTPVIPPIGVEATGFVALYNPTQSQLSSFSQYLWSNDFIDNFKKLFANPMDAIIGLHMIYATPSRGSEAEIVCGYAHSGVMSNTVNSQYIEIDCGSIKVNRYFGNVLDYAPYTKLQLYLPFVGIVDLDTNEIMNGTLNIKYRIDVLTGSCLARLRITRGDYNAELYNFAGNCAVQLPISGGSYSGIIANAIGVAGSIGATIASGGALAPVLVGSAVSSAINSHVNVSHSGSLGSNAGALGIMKPYLIITRPKPAEADNFNEFYGKPSNKTVRLSSCSGYTRIKDVHVDNIVATDNELSEIEKILKEGVII